MGLNALAATLAEDAGTLEDVVEPYLLKIGFIIRTSRGRQATERAYEHLGLTPDEAPPLRAGHAAGVQRGIAPRGAPKRPGFLPSDASPEQEHAV